MKQLQSLQSLSQPLRPGVSEQPPAGGPPQTFAAHVFVPLLQNVLGGLAILGMSAILAVAAVRFQGAEPDLPSILAWSGLLGGFVTCGVTVVRFFGDDVGLVQLAYRRGRESAQARIYALELELEEASSRLAHILRKTGSAPPAKALQQWQRTHAAAQMLIRWHFEGLPLDRRSCEQRAMSQGEWRRARQLLIAAGVLDETGICVHDLNQAKKLALAHYHKAYKLGAQTPNFVAPQ